MKISEIASRIAMLEGELERQIELDIEDQKRRKLQYTIEKGKITFASEASALHKKLHKGVVAFLWEAPVASLLGCPDDLFADRPTFPVVLLGSVVPGGALPCIRNCQGGASCAAMYCSTRDTFSTSTGSSGSTATTAGTPTDWWLSRGRSPPARNSTFAQSNMPSAVQERTHTMTSFLIR